MDSLNRVIDYYKFSHRGRQGEVGQSSVLKWTDFGASLGDKRHLSNFLFYAKDSNEECVKINKRYKDLYKIDQAMATSRLEGRVKECVSGGE